MVHVWLLQAVFAASRFLRAVFFLQPAKFVTFLILLKNKSHLEEMFYKDLFAQYECPSFIFSLAFSSDTEMLQL